MDLVAGGWHLAGVRWLPGRSAVLDDYQDGALLLTD
jgi:hypothetical protein